MFDVFIGQHENKIDAKARLSIPADFRKVIDQGHQDREPGTAATFLLVFGDERTPYLEGMTLARLKKITKQIRRMPKSDPRRNQLEEAIYEKSQQLVLDDTGRIVLPARGRDKLGISANDTVVFAGRGDSFRLWKPEAHATATERPPADPTIDYDPDRDPMDYLDGDEDDEE